MNKKTTCYLLRTTHEGKYYYVFNKRILLHNADMARKFTSMKGALRFYKSSDFFKDGVAVSVVPYEKTINLKNAI